MYQILEMEDYNLQKLDESGGIEYEEVTTEKATRIDVTDVAKPKGKLFPFGRTTQKQLSGKNLANAPSELIITPRYKEIPCVAEAGSYVLSLDEWSTQEGAEYSYSTVQFYGENNRVIANGRLNNTNYRSVNLNFNEKLLFMRIYSQDGYAPSAGITSTIKNLMFRKSTYDDTYEPYVGGTASPNPDYPQEIENVEGRSCRNLFDKNSQNIVPGKYLNTDGTTANNNNFSVSDWIEVEANQEYSIQPHKGLSAAVCFYDNNKEFISGITLNAVNPSLTTPNNCKYIRSSFINTDADIFQINEGPVPLPYEPYFEGKRLEFNVCNKNLLDINKSIPNKNIFASGQILDSLSNNLSDYIDISAFSNLYIYFEYNGTLSWNTCFFDSQKNVISGGANGISSKIREMTKPSNASYIRFCYPKDATKVMLAGSTATSYEEHKEQMIPFPLSEGQKLMEGDYLAEDGVHHTRKQIELSGANTETWYKNTDYSTENMLVANLSANNITDIKSGTNKLKCSHFKYASPTTINSFRAIGNALGFGLDINTFADINEWKTWLQSNPIIVEYELAEETIEPYTEAQAKAYNKLMNLMLYKGVNHIWTEIDGLEPNLQLTYKRKKQSNVLQVSNVQPLNN